MWKFSCVRANDNDTTRGRVVDTILKLPSIALSRRLPIIEQKSITEIGNMLRGYGENLNAILCTFIVKTLP